MRKFVTFIIIAVSIVAGAMFIKAMMELEKEASSYLDSKQESKDKESLEKAKSEPNPQPDPAAGNTKSAGEKIQIQTLMKTLLDDPNMPEDLKDQPELVINELYNDLFFDLILSEEQKTKFTDLVLESANAGSDDKTSTAENLDNEIKELVGDLYYEDYKQYNNTLRKRTKVIHYKYKLASFNVPLMPTQQSSLLDVMLEDCEQECDKNILDKSGEFLDAEQIAALEEFLAASSDT